METVELLFSKSVSLDDLHQKLLCSWQGASVSADTLVVEDSRGRVYIHYCDDAPGSGIFLDYSDIELVKDVLLVIGDDPDVLIDNDFGTVLPGDQFVERIRSQPEWNWRLDHQA